MKLIAAILFLFGATNAMADVIVPGMVRVTDSMTAELFYKALPGRERAVSVNHRMGAPRPGDPSIQGMEKSSSTDDAGISCTKIPAGESFSYSCVGQITSRNTSSVKKTKH